MHDINSWQVEYLFTYLVLNSQKTLGPFQYTFFNLKVGTYLLTYYLNKKIGTWSGTYFLSFKNYPNYPTDHLKTKGKVKVI